MSAVLDGIVGLGSNNRHLAPGDRGHARLRNARAAHRSARVVGGGRTITASFKSRTCRLKFVTLCRMQPITRAPPGRLRLSSANAHHARAATRGSLNTGTSRAIPEGSRPCLHRQSKGDRRAQTRRGIYRCVAMSHLGVGFSPSIFEGGSDARTALDDAVRHGNNPDRCTCTGSDVRSALPGLHAGLQQRRQLDRVWLYIDG
jgi:hypothetical protein